MAPMDEEEDTRLPEENQEVDPSITLCHKIFLLSNPDLCDDVDVLGEEVKDARPRTQHGDALPGVLREVRVDDGRQGAGGHARQERVTRH